MKISTAAAPFVRGEASREEKEAAARGEISLPQRDLVTVLYFLCCDRDGEIRREAGRTLRELPPEMIREYLLNADPHPRIAEYLTQIFPPADLEEDENDNELLPAVAEDEEEYVAEEGEENPPEEEEEYLSKYQLAQQMGVADKIKMALTGDKEWRSILVKDSNKLVNGAVVKNPRLTEAEVIGILKSSVQNDEIIRTISRNKEWLKNYQIRKALVENHKTPLPQALRLMNTLTEKDLAAMAKSKNISSVISTQARKLLLNKSKR